MRTLMLFRVKNFNFICKIRSEREKKCCWVKLILFKLSPHIGFFLHRLLMILCNLIMSSTYLVNQPCTRIYVFRSRHIHRWLDQPDRWWMPMGEFRNSIILLSTRDCFVSVSIADLVANHLISLLSPVKLSSLMVANLASNHKIQINFLNFITVNCIA